MRTLVVSAALTLAAVAWPAAGRADHDDQTAAIQDAVVEFGAPQPQGSPAAITHLLLPDDVNVLKGGTVTFVVNGGGHGVAIYPVAKKTTRDDVAADLCQGGSDEADRLGRSLVCNGAIVTASGIVGTQNLHYQVIDGKDNLVIDVPENTAATPNPRVDDPTDRLLATSGAIPGATGVNPAGAFLVGTQPGPPVVPGNRIRVQFLKSGRYLVICMNRAHSLNDHMFGFVNVIGDDDEQ
jgi:plastocyanin